MTSAVAVYNQDHAHTVPLPPLRFRLSTGSATQEKVLADLIEGDLSAHELDYLGSSESNYGKAININLARRRWLELKWSHFTQQGRKQRIERALAALHRVAIRYDLDSETIKWIAEDPDLEDL